VPQPAKHDKVDVLQEWVKKENKKFKAEKRHIVLLLDNAPTHIVADVAKKVVRGFELYYLSNVTLIFLPANTTSVVQPLDQGIISAFKASYRRYLVCDTIEQLDSDADLTIAKIKPDMLKVVKWVRASAKGLTLDTIRNCWFKAGILGPDKVPAPPPRSVRRHIRRHGQPVVRGVEACDDMLSGEENDEEVQPWELTWLQEDLDELSLLVQRRPGVLEQGDGIASAVDFGHLSGEEETFEELTDAEIVELVVSDQQEGLEDEDDCDCVFEPAEKATLNECAQMLETVECVLADHTCFGMDDAEVVMALKHRILQVITTTSKQTDLHDYFKRQ